MVLSTVALLADDPDPSEESIRHGLEGNICRCTGYHNIVRSVQTAAKPWPREQHRTSIESRPGASEVEP